MGAHPEMSGHTNHNLWYARRGEVFGELTVLGYDYEHRTRGNVLCECSCGDVDSYQYRSLQHGSTKSCGCKTQEWKVAGHIKHGLSKTYQYHMWVNARLRARARGWEFSIELSDVIIPEKCPVFGIILFTGSPNGHDGRPQDNAPSLDRVDSTRGYTKDNIRVISWRANRLKQAMTALEARQLADYMENHVCSL